MAVTAGAKRQDAGEIVPLLKRREGLFRAKLWLMVGMGAPLSLVGPLVLGTMFWVVCLLMWRWTPWTWWFWGSVGVVVPLLYLQEMRVGAGHLTDAVKGGNAGAAAGLWALSRMKGGGMLAVAAIAAHPRASAAGFVELFVFGPRQVVSAVRQWRAARALGTADVARAAEVVSVLEAAKGAVALTALKKPGEGMEAVVGAAGYLAYFDWIGVGERGDRAWMLTEARETLKQLK